MLALIPAIPNLLDLDISEVGITNKCVEALGQHCTSLQRLLAKGCVYGLPDGAHFSLSGAAATGSDKGGDGAERKGGDDGDAAARALHSETEDDADDVDVAGDSVDEKEGPGHLGATQTRWPVSTSAYGVSEETVKALAASLRYGK